jgi:pimeloyl-ACP methyl ester carboxylesterase
VYHKALKFSNLELDKDLKYRNIPIYEEEHMHEVYTTGPRTLPHLVLIHGYGGTSLSFIRTFYYLKNHFQVHALDTFGVGLSSRNTWKDTFSAE